MRVRIGGLVIEDVTLDDLDTLIERYGSGVEAAGSDAAPNGEQPPKPGQQAKHHRPSGASPTDAVLLRKFVSSSPTGVPTGEVGSMLGKQGKAIRPAAKVWAKRIGLSQDENHDPFVDCRVGTQRGLRINDHLMDLAKELAK